MNRMRLVLGLMLSLLAGTASATFHTFRIEQLYSNADGTVQFVVLRESFGQNGENLWQDRTLSTVRTGQSQMEIVFPSPLVSFDTARQYVLVATDGFAALGLIKPDYLIPSGFLGTQGGQIDFAGVDAVAHGPLPKDGVSAVFRDGTVGPNIARNFRGESASIKAAVPPPPPPPAATAQVVEYYYAAWDYYFITAFPAEVALLDGGAYGGVWKRTGESFNVWPGSTPASSPTCRFFSTSFAPKSSHFYTPFPSECTTVKVSPDWEYENVAFHLELATAGACSSQTVPLYRLYNNGKGGAPNHRYTTSPDLFNAMRAQGWVAEGDGVTFVFACVPK